MTTRRFLRHGVLAIEPRALQALAALELPKVDRSNVAASAATVVRIQGPLEHHATEECDSYDAILARVDAACAAPQPTVVLAIDSPGGLVSGCFETARTIRTRCAAAGKKLIAYVDGHACSAAYALACAAERIVAPEAALVGSVGVLDVRVDMSAMDAAMGVQFAFIASGARKADGQAHLAFTPDELADRQRVVDSLAGVFFAAVSDARGLTPAKVAALEARIFSGQAAIAAGLIDSIATMDELLASLSAGSEATMASEYETARAALQKAAEGDGEEAARAKRALAAMDGDEPAAEGDGEPDGDEPAAEGDGEPDGDEKPKDKPAAAAAPAAVSAQTAGELGAIVAQQGKQLAALTMRLEGQERAELLAARPDLPKALKALLATKPVAEVKSILATMPKAAVPNPAASATPAATRGATQGNGQASQLPPDQKAKLDERMGLTSSKLGAVQQGNKLILGAPVPASGKDA